MTIVCPLAFLANFLIWHSYFWLSFFFEVPAVNIARLGNQPLALATVIALITSLIPLTLNLVVLGIVLTALLLTRDPTGQGEKLHQVDTLDLSSQCSLEVLFFFGAVLLGGARGRAVLGYAFLDLLHQLVVLVEEF